MIAVGSHEHVDTTELVHRLFGGCDDLVSVSHVRGQRQIARPLRVEASDQEALLLEPSDDGRADDPLGAGDQGPLAWLSTRHEATSFAVATALLAALAAPPPLRLVDGAPRRILVGPSNRYSSTSRAIGEGDLSLMTMMS